MRRSAGLAASLFLTVLSLAGCGKGGVIGSGPLPTPTPIVPKVTNEFAIPTAASQPGGITVGSDTYLYFTEQATANIGQATIGGSMAEESIATGGGTAGVKPIDVVTGPDSNLWYTYQGSPSGGIAAMQLRSWKVAQYPIAGSNPTFIAEGPVFNTVVFSDPGNNAMGMFDLTTNAVTEKTIPTANANPMGLLVLSNDSNDVFFVEHDASKIGVWNARTNTITAEYSTPTANAGPTEIVEGPGHTIWFTENSVAKIAQMTPSGQITEYPLSPATSATALVSARDNNIYFVDQLQNKIGSISAVAPAAVTEYAVPTANAFPAAGPNVFPGKMILGPDGRVYFTEPAANKIGQLNY